MNIFTRVKEFFMNLFKTSAEKEFNVDIIASDLMEIAQTECACCARACRGSSIHSPFPGC